MNLVESILELFFQEILWGTIKRIGAAVRWMFMSRKYSYNDIYQKDWNGSLGVITICLIVVISWFLYSKFNVSQKYTTKASEELELLSQNDEIKNGDLIFQTSLSEQSKAIQLATHSKYSHCGIIYKEKGLFYVYEAIQPVKTTPLDKWILRGKNRHYVIKRLKNASQVLTTETVQKMKKEGEKFKGKNYDLTFEWSDDKIYCSELIWKIYQRATGIEIGKLEKLSDFNLTNKIVKKKMKERYGDKIPLNEIVISPAAIFDSELLITVKSN
jgi:uncharacterized protein YycO